MHLDAQAAQTIQYHRPCGLGRRCEGPEHQGGAVFAWSGAPRFHARWSRSLSGRCGAEYLPLRKPVGGAGLGTADWPMVVPGFGGRLCIRNRATCRYRSAACIKKTRTPKKCGVIGCVSALPPVRAAACGALSEVVAHAHGEGAEVVTRSRHAVGGSLVVVDAGVIGVELGALAQVVVIAQRTTVRLKIKQNQLVSVAIRLDW